MNNDVVVRVTVAILYRNNQFLMQLRDNIPGIIYPGHWGFFGGHIEVGEGAEEALNRELLEEIGFVPPVMKEFGLYRDEKVIRHVYQGALTVGLDQLVLGEGWDMGLLTPEEIRRGEGYSEKAGGMQPLGGIHQKILLDFMASGLGD